MCSAETDTLGLENRRRKKKKKIIQKVALCNIELNIPGLQKTTSFFFKTNLKLKTKSDLKGQTNLGQGSIYRELFRVGTGFIQRQSYAKRGVVKVSSVA